MFRKKELSLLFFAPWLLCCPHPDVVADDFKSAKLAAENGWYDWDWKEERSPVVEVRKVPEKGVWDGGTSAKIIIKIEFLKLKFGFKILF